MDGNEIKIKILIVDDEQASRDVLVDLLTSDDREIRTANDGLSAREILTAEPFDLVLTDLNMPGMNGMELLRFVKSKYPQALVVIITGYATLENTLNAIDEGAYDYITKPFKLAEMDILIRNACEKINLTRERDTVVDQIEKTREEVEVLSKRVMTMHSRIQQLEEREESLFLGNFDLRLPVSQESMTRRYAAQENTDKNRELLIARMAEMKENGEMSEEDFLRYLQKLSRN